MPSAEHIHLEEAIGAAFVGLAVALLQQFLPPAARRVFAWSAAAVALVLVAVDFAPVSLLLGTALALGAGLIPRVIPSLAVSAAALLFVATRFPGAATNRLIVATVLVGAAAGVGMYVSEKLIGRRWLSVLLAISAGGVYACVPDTEQIAVVFGVLAALAGAYVLFNRRLDGPEAMAAAGATLAVLLVWSGGVGSIGRPAALAGVAACLGVVIALPVAWLLLTPIRRGYDPSVPVVVLLAAQAALIYPAARVIGLELDVQTAAAGASLLLIGTTCALAVVGLIAALARGRITSEPALPLL